MTNGKTVTLTEDEAGLAQIALSHYAQACVMNGEKAANYSYDAASVANQMRSALERYTAATELSGRIGKQIGKT